MKHELITQFQEVGPEPVALSELGIHLKDDDGTVTRLQTPANGLSKAEKSPDYYRTIAYLNSDWRLILCKTGIQWILQKRRGVSKWEGHWFVRTKQGLMGGLGNCGHIEEAALMRIHELPDRCVEP